MKRGSSLRSRIETPECGMEIPRIPLNEKIKNLAIGWKGDANSVLGRKRPYTGRLFGQENYCKYNTWVLGVNPKANDIGAIVSDLDGSNEWSGMFIDILLKSSDGRIIYSLSSISINPEILLKLLDRSTL
ncbi:hypothetical protein NPIL_503841 [Nephila pilipes]|uniref:Uncharacterized protein n=1 Tax=Nephila pilipes TaxID=299642 RepID=A0A8X6P4V5_NEPPI|nr:hypothetical protein NPIL_503841 [Nephila pilipes]